jgi:ribosomal protein L24E
MRKNKTERLAFRATKPERRQWTKLAKAAQLNVSEWIRARLVEAAAQEEEP